MSRAFVLVNSLIFLLFYLGKQGNSFAENFAIGFIWFSSIGRILTFQNKNIKKLMIMQRIAHPNFKPFWLELIFQASFISILAARKHWITLFVCGIDLILTYSLERESKLEKSFMK